MYRLFYLYKARIKVFGRLFVLLLTVNYLANLLILFIDRLTIFCIILAMYMEYGGLF